MIGTVAAIASAIPSIVKLFDEDERKEGVKELTGTVVKEAGKALGVEFNDKQDVMAHLKQNPDSVIKLKNIDNRYKVDILEAILADKNSARKADNVRQAAKDWLVRNAGALIAITTVACTFGLWAFMLFGDFGNSDGLNQSILLAINSSLTMSLGYVLSFYFGSSKTEADSKRI